MLILGWAYSQPEHVSKYTDLHVFAKAYPDRFIPGFGTSSHAIVEGWHGLKLEKPLTRMQETVALMRSMMAGEKTDFAGDTLRNHIAYSATRLELLGGWASPAARWAVELPWLLPPLAAASVAIDLMPSRSCAKTTRRCSSEVEL